jgi:DNA-directed RNA polymerase subunit RPC12/RpoP
MQKTVESLKERVRCPYCGARIFVKLRPKVLKKVLAR